VGDAGLAALAAQAEHLGSLQVLELWDTQVGDAGLEALAAQAKHLGSLQNLQLMGAQVKSVRADVLRTCDAREIFKALLRGFVVPEAKLLVLGEPAVGRTWLCQRVFQDTIPTERTETHDFELIRPAWRPQIAGNVEVQLRVWDFGGQHILHGTKTAGRRTAKGPPTVTRRARIRTASVCGALIVRQRRTLYNQSVGCDRVDMQSDLNGTDLVSCYQQNSYPK
jgi:hypothetical protein